jgi:hypothetical protein
MLSREETMNKWQSEKARLTYNGENGEYHKHRVKEFS